MKPIISKNLTPLPPFPRREGGFKASPRFGERFTRGVCLYIKNLFKHPLKRIYGVKTQVMDFSRIDKIVFELMTLLIYEVCDETTAANSQKD
ncbi:MAG: hypothetical protein PX483_14475 [Nostocales cyanobacterium LE14-WE4]|jgi:hypothetical protein|nr:hypothetical protein [Anabaena sp. 49633_E8]MCE2702792.1 hypothetical protein [Anabaena sp. 49633_E8]MDJ0502029.1 hypothetical protein [Nostocales cyanobacterium LE14-WE4]